MHLRRGKEFQRVYERKQRTGDAMLLVFGCENDLPHARLGLSVSRKVGTAVVRNRWKRLIREAFRLSQHELPEGLDLIVIPRPDVEPELERLADSLRRLAGQLAKRLKRQRNDKVTG